MFKICLTAKELATQTPKRQLGSVGKENETENRWGEILQQGTNAVVLGTVHAGAVMGGGVAVCIGTGEVAGGWG